MARLSRRIQMRMRTMMTTTFQRMTLKMLRTVMLRNKIWHARKLWMEERLTRGLCWEKRRLRLSNLVNCATLKCSLVDYL